MLNLYGWCQEAISYLQIKISKTKPGKKRKLTNFSNETSFRFSSLRVEVFLISDVILTSLFIELPFKSNMFSMSLGLLILTVLAIKIKLTGMISSIFTVKIP